MLQHHSKKPLSGSEVLAAAKARLGISKDFGGKSGSKGKANIGVSSKAKAKANLLKLRRKAVGDSYVPEADRVYFEMVFEEQRVPMWMNRRWNVSRVVKEFRDYLRLRIGIAVQEKSGFLLALFVQDGMGGKEGRSLLDIDAALEDLMEQKTIHDGATLSMEFIPTLS